MTDSIDNPKPATPRQPIARCTYCGQSYYSTYAVNRAAWDGCDNCGKLNVVEMSQ